MIWSVSMLLLGSGNRRLSNFMDSSSEHCSNVGHDACQRGSGGGERTHQEGAASLALAAFEVAVTGRDTILTWLQLIAVHRDTHRAARLAPVAAGVAENLRQALSLG